MDNPQETHGVSDVDIGWLAGIIDGEGSINLAMGYVRNGRLNNMSPRVEVANTDKELVEKYIRILKALGCGVYMVLKKEGLQSKLVKAQTGKGFRPIYYAKSVGFLRTKRILETILPHITGEKKVRAELILKFIKSRMIKTNGTKCGNRVDYDQEDIKNALAIARTMRTKFIPVLEGLLRDCTRSRQLKLAV